jgi:hypothetical protein
VHLLIICVLAVGCIGILIAIPAGAHRGKLHVPGYAGIAILAFIASFLFGIASGYRPFAGSPVGIALSLLCFWSAAACVGSILALFFCRSHAEV